MENEKNDNVFRLSKSQQKLMRYWNAQFKAMEENFKGMLNMIRIEMEHLLIENFMNESDKEENKDAKPGT